MAVSVKMSGKNQIVVPARARDALGLRPGDRLLVTVVDGTWIRMEREPPRTVERLAGALRPEGDGPRPDLWEELEGG